MVDELCWYFKISEKAGLCIDENGEKGPCYMAYKLNFKEPIDEGKITKTYEEQAEAIRKDTAGKMHIPEEWLEIISEKEYLENTEEDE